jgi:hypothetical protein
MKYVVIHTSSGLKSVPAESVFAQQDVWFEGSYEECELHIQSLYDSQEPDPENNGGNCDDYLLESYSDY